MNEILRLFAERIRELRIERDLGIREEAAKIGISPSAISRYEKGERAPDIIIINKFADFFNVTGDYLIGRTDKRK